MNCFDGFTNVPLCSFAVEEEGGITPATLPGTGDEGNLQVRIALRIHTALFNKQ
jgi:hypothetical protein